MADKSFGVKDINLIGASGTPTIDSPNNLNINAINVAISTDITVGNKLSLGTGTSISSPGTNILALGTNNLERIRVGSAGQIGLGGANYGSSGQVLTSNGSGSAPTWQTVSGGGGGGISNVVEDTTPQLGGNLDLNSKDITGTGNLDVTGIITATSFSGSGSNLTALTGASAGTYGDSSHVSTITVDSNGRITNISESGIPSSIANVVEDTTPQLGGNLQTNSNDIIFADNDEAIFGTNSDLRIDHDGTDNHITSGDTDLNIELNPDISTPKIYIRPNTSHQGITLGGGSGNPVELYCFNSKKFETTDVGVTVTGNIAVTGTVDGRDLVNDGNKLDGIASNATAYGDSDVDTHLNRTQQVSQNYILSWNGSDYAWVAQSGAYSDNDVDNHLNRTQQITQNYVLSWNGSDYAWVAQSGGGGLSDGDYGDITVSNSGQTFTIDNSAITSAKINNGAIQTVDISNNQVTPAKINLNYAKFVGTGTPNINSSTTYGEVTWINTTPQFSNGTWSATSSHIVVPETGLYLVQVNLYVTSAAVRSNVGLKFAVNDTQQSEIAAHNYIRNSGGHAEASINMSTTLSLSANDQVSIYVARLAAAGTVTLNGTNSTIAITQLS